MPILRAGLVLVEQISTVLPSQVTYHVGLVRNEETLQVTSRYQKETTMRRRKKSLIVRTKYHVVDNQKGLEMGRDFGGGAGHGERGGGGWTKGKYGLDISHMLFWWLASSASASSVPTYVL